MIILYLQSKINILVINMNYQYINYINKRISAQVNIRNIINSSYSVEEEFWRLWKKNILKVYSKYEEDNYDFLCIKTDFHNK